MGKIKKMRKKNEKRTKKIVKKGMRGTDERELEREEREKEMFFFLSLLSKIYGNRTVGFCQSKRQIWSTHRELLVGIKILELRQTPRDREFSYLGYF